MAQLPMINSQTSQKLKLTILLFQPCCVKGRLLLSTINIALINKKNVDNNKTLLFHNNGENIINHVIFKM